MNINEKIMCFVPCPTDKIERGQCSCANRIGLEWKKSGVVENIICPNCGNDKLINIAEEVSGGYKCADCGIRFKEGKNV